MAPPGAISIFSLSVLAVDCQSLVAQTDATLDGSASHTPRFCSSGCADSGACGGGVDERRE